LAREVGGAMPGCLAGEYGRAVASALRLAHERGGVHGDVRPANLLVGPLTAKLGPDGQERRRSAPDAVIRLAELGLVPLRPPATAYHIEGALAPFYRPGTVPAAQLAPVAVPMADPASRVGYAGLVAVPVAAPAPEAADGWGVDPATFSVAHASADAAPRKREV